MNFASSKNMVVLSTWFPHKQIHKRMWKASDGNTINQIDHVLVDKRYTNHILDVRTKRGANVDSDHFLVVAKMRTKIIHRVKEKRTSPVQKPWNTERLRDENIRTQFECTMEANLKETNWQEEQDPNKLWSLLKNGLQVSADGIWEKGSHRLETAGLMRNARKLLNGKTQQEPEP